MNKLWGYITAVFVFLLALIGYEYKRKEEAEGLLKNEETKQKDVELQQQQANNNADIQEQEKKVNQPPPEAPNASKDEVEGFWNTKK